MKNQKPLYSQSDNYEEFVSRHRHLRQVHLGFTPAIFPFGYEFEERESSAWMMMAASSMFFLFIVDKGLNVFNIDKDEYRLEPGELMIIPQDFCYTSHTYGYTIRHVLELKGEFLKNMVFSQGLDRPILLNLKDDPDILDAIRNIGPLVDTDNVGVYCEIMGKVYEIMGRLACLIQKHSRGKTVIKQILEALQSNGTEKENMDHLCRKFGISRSSIIRMVNKQVGMSPKEFCIAERMKKAVHLLEYSSISIKEIAFSLGYCNPFYFSMEFKRKNGISPTAYRQLIKNMPYQKKKK